MFDERMINFFESHHVPNTYWKDRSATYLYWLRALYERLCATLEFKIPDNWSREYFHLCLYTFGVIPVFKTARWGVTFTGMFSFSGYDWFYEPVNVMVSNPKLTKRFTIGKDCELLRLTSDWFGCWDICSFFAEKLSEASQGVDVALQNSKLAIVLNAHTEAQAQTLAKVVDKIKQGNAAVIYDPTMYEYEDEMVPQGDDPFQSFINDLKKNYIGTELLDNINTIMNQFYREIGLVGESTEHGQSHTLNIEAEQQESNSTARLDCWMKNLEDSIKKVNAMFDIGLEVKRRECKIANGNNAQRIGSTEHAGERELDS